MLGQLYYFDKETKVRTLFGSVIRTFSYEDNINETPSNTKIKIINNIRKDLEPNTICWHDETQTWWVVKADKSVYIQTGEYEHDLDLVEAFEYLNYIHLPNHAYRADEYTFLQMMERLFRIAKFPYSFSFSGSLPSTTQTMPMFSFEGFTLASAIKTIARSLNAIPKLSFTTTTSGGNTILNAVAIVFINRFGKDMIPLQGLNENLTTQYEVFNNTSDRFATRAVLNMKNALSSQLVNAFGIRPYTKNEPTINEANAQLPLNSAIDRVASITPMPYASIDYWQLTAGAYNKIATFWNGYYTNSVSKVGILSNILAFGSYRYFTTDQLRTIIFPDENINEIKLNDPLGSFITNRPFYGFLTLKDYPNYTTESSTTNKEKYFSWEQGQDGVIVAKKFVGGLTSQSEWNKNVILLEATVGSNKDFIVLNFVSETSINPALSIDLPLETTLFKVSYYPVGDIKASYDNENASQDERFLNQTGKMIDAYSASQQAYANISDSASSSLIRSSRYSTFGDVLDVGTLIKDTNDGMIYVVNQRSIDVYDNYYSVIYNLSKGRIARSENINADSNIVDFQIPQQNLIKRNQLYKDYVEFSIDGAISGRPTPYLSLDNAFTITNTQVGSLLDNYNYYGKGTTAGNVDFFYYLQPVVYDLALSKLLTVDYKDNNIIGYSITKNAGVYDQLIKTYTDANGELASIRSVFSLTTPETQVATLPLVSSSFYNARVGIVIDEPNYAKDQYEIPNFTYQLQTNGTFDTKGSVLLANDLLRTFRPPLVEKNFVEYRYIVSNNRFTNENALAIYNTIKVSTLTPYENRLQVVDVVRTSNSVLTHNLFSSLALEWTSTSPAVYNTECYPRYDGGTHATLSAFLTWLPQNYPAIGMNRFAGIKAFITALGYEVYYRITETRTTNTTSLLGKNIGIFAIYYNETFGFENRRKFLYAINDYSGTSNSSIVLTLNNWKI